MDDAHITLLNINIKKEWFESYECGEDENISFNSTIITSILNLYSPKTVITFTTDEDLDFLNISLQYIDNSVKSFSLPLIDIDGDLLCSNPIECGIDLSISTKRFDKIVSEHALFGDTVDIVYNNNTFYMRTTGDLGEYKLKIPKETLSIIENVSDYKTYNKISLKYLSFITKLHSVFDKITIKISSDDGNPLTVQYYEDITDKSNDLLEIIYYIAPKFQDDDEEINYNEFEY
jgi:proliferating cell nuclear antigen|tara:strand:+ start:985 stop:1683 length:699 start_codon:yes stop_codon:yes gene_type:complete